MRISIRHLSKRSICIYLLLFFSLIITACRPKPADQGIVYLPPTPAATRASPTYTASPTSVFRPTPTPPCANNLVFLSDLTIPDATIVTPGEQLDKRWEVENRGSCNWDRKYSLRLIAGQDLGAGEQQALFPARSGTNAVIRVIFTAPNDAGIYRSAWQAFGPDGEPFGDPIFIEIEVAPTTSEGSGG
jgi:hypothetical protein